MKYIYYNKIKGIKLLLDMISFTVCPKTRTGVDLSTNGECTFQTDILE